MGDFGPSLSSTEAPVPESPSDPAAAAEDINVLVTGFGPFKNQPINPSFLIASSLPPTVTVPDSPHPVRIYIHPSPVRVSYPAVQRAVPGLVEAFECSHGGRAPDIIIHIGMASVRRYYAVETTAHRDGYTMTDVDGQTGYEYGEAQWKEAELPETLQPGTDGCSPTPTTPPKSTTSTAGTMTATTKSEAEAEADKISHSPPLPSRPATFSIANITSSLSLLDLNTTAKPRVRSRPSPPDNRFLHAWRSQLSASADIRLSHDPGRYLCEFIYYASLAHALRAGRDRSVVFLHVPGWTDEDSVERGRDVTVALVKALVGCWVS